MTNSKDDKLFFQKLFTKNYLYNIDVFHRLESKYLYRIEGLGSLKLIQKEGHRCGKSSPLLDMGYPKSETELAREDGWKIPPLELQDKPRIYFWGHFNKALQKSFSQLSFISRYSRQVPSLSCDQLIFPDGAISEDAVYTIFLNLKENDVAILPDFIDVWINGKWKPLKKINLDSIYLCKGCGKRLSKYEANHKAHKNYLGLYCESCNRPL